MKRTFNIKQLQEISADTFEIKEGSILQYLVEEGYIPSKFLSNDREAYNNLYVKIYRESKQGKFVMLWYNELVIGILCNQCASTIEVQGLFVENSSAINSRLAQPHSKILDNCLFSHLNCEPATEDFKKVLNANFKRYGNNSYANIEGHTDEINIGIPLPFYVDESNDNAESQVAGRSNSHD